VNNPTPHTVRIKYISKKLASIIFRYQHKATSKVLQNKNFSGQAKHYATSIRLEAKYYKTHISADKPNIMQMLGLTNL